MGNRGDSLSIDKDRTAVVVLNFKDFIYFFQIYTFNVYLFLRETETECEWVRAESEGDTESEAGSRL